MLHKDGGRISKSSFCFGSKKIKFWQKKSSFGKKSRVTRFTPQALPTTKHDLFSLKLFGLTREQRGNLLL
jgi:hypothetical protein